MLISELRERGLDEQNNNCHTTCSNSYQSQSRAIRTCQLIKVSCHETNSLKFCDEEEEKLLALQRQEFQFFTQKSDKLFPPSSKSISTPMTRNISMSCALDIFSATFTPPVVRFTPHEHVDVFRIYVLCTFQILIYIYLCAPFPSYRRKF